jgi:Domain of unknown function (DUF1851)
MNIHDYLLAQEDKDWARLLKDWVPPLPATFTVWLVNLLGEVFVVANDESVLRLDTGAGTCIEVARNREQFARLLDTGDNAEQWLRIRLVNACRSAGMKLKSFECYSFRLPPTLGGRYEIGNLTPTNLAVHFSYQSYICKQADIYWIPPD